MRPERYTYSYDVDHRPPSLKRRVLMLLLVLLGVGMLIASRLDAAVIDRLRIRALDILQPGIETVNTPVRLAKNWFADKHALLDAHEENRKLREENERLREWQGVAKALKAENENLRKLAGYKPVEEITYVTAQVVAQSPGAYRASVMIDAGTTQHIPSLAPVIDSDGLIGRTIEVGETTSRVLLLSDPASRVPVVTEESRHRAILAGTGENLLRMTFIEGDAAQIALGETVMTTAQGGLMPESVVVGTVFRREQSGEVLVKPPRPLAQAEYVRVMVAP